MTKSDFIKKFQQSINNVRSKTPATQEKRRGALNSLERAVTGKGKKGNPKIEFEGIMAWIKSKLEYELLEEQRTYQRWGKLAGIIKS